ERNGSTVDGRNRVVIAAVEGSAISVHAGALDIDAVAGCITRRLPGTSRQRDRAGTVGIPERDLGCDGSTRAPRTADYVVTAMSGIGRHDRGQALYLCGHARQRTRGSVRPADRDRRQIYRRKVLGR